MMPTRTGIKVALAIEQRTKALLRCGGYWNQEEALMSAIGMVEQEMQIVHDNNADVSQAGRRLRERLSRVDWEGGRMQRGKGEAA